MKPKIWNEEEAKIADKDQLFFKLVQCPEHGDISVIVLDKEGKAIPSCHLVTFDFDLKYLVIADGVNPRIPLKTDILNSLLYIETRDLLELKKEEMHSRFIDKIMQSKQLKDEKVSTH
jgi:hypothetical protein